MYALYGKRTGKKIWNEPIYDRRFAALDYNGIRVGKLDKAAKFKTKEEAWQFFYQHKCDELERSGLCEYEVRKVR